MISRIQDSISADERRQALLEAWIGVSVNRLRKVSGASVVGAERQRVKIAAVQLAPQAVGMSVAIVHWRVATAWCCGEASGKRAELKSGLRLRGYSRFRVFRPPLRAVSSPQPRFRTS